MTTGAATVNGPQVDLLAVDSPMSVAEPARSGSPATGRVDDRRDDVVGERLYERAESQADHQADRNENGYSPL